MQENKKALYIGIAAAGVAVACAAIYYMSSKSKGGEQAISDKLSEAKLTEVKKGENGQLDQTYFLSLLQFVGQETRLRTTDLRKHCHDERRKHYKDQNWKEYESVIKKTIENEDITA